MKKIFATVGSFLIVFGLFYNFFTAHAQVSRDDKVTNVTSKNFSFEVVSGPKINFSGEVTFTNASKKDTDLVIASEKDTLYLDISKCNSIVNSKCSAPLLGGPYDHVKQVKFNNLNFYYNKPLKFTLSVDAKELESGKYYRFSLNGLRKTLEEKDDINWSNYVDTKFVVSSFEIKKLNNKELFITTKYIYNNKLKSGPVAKEEKELQIVVNYMPVSRGNAPGREVFREIFEINPEYNKERVHTYTYRANFDIDSKYEFRVYDAKSNGSKGVILNFKDIPLNLSINNAGTSGLVGKIDTDLGAAYRNFDVNVTKSEVSSTGILSIETKLTGVKTGTSRPAYQIVTKKDFESGTVQPSFFAAGTIDFVKDKEVTESFSKTVTPGDYVLQFFDTSTAGIVYTPKAFKVETPKSEETPSKDPGRGEDSVEDEEESGPVIGELLSPDAKLKNPFKALGSFEKIASAFLTGIVIPVGIPVLAIAIMYTGFLFVAARGNPTKLDDAKKAAFWTAVGGFIMLGSLTIVRILQSTFDNISGSL